MRMKSAFTFIALFALAAWPGLQATYAASPAASEEDTAGASRPGFSSAAIGKRRPGAGVGCSIGVFKLIG